LEWLDSDQRALILAAQEKIKAGVLPERLLALVNAASMPRNCKTRESKRFMLGTEVGTPAEISWAKFANGAVIVSGAGTASLNANKQPEAWFEQKKPVKIRFTILGGKVSAAEGTLPLTHTIIDDNAEYRFTVTPAAARGFVDVVGVSCDYPK
jgi:hypothetical protein